MGNFFYTWRLIPLDPHDVWQHEMLTPATHNIHVQQQVKDKRHHRKTMHFNILSRKTMDDYNELETDSELLTTQAQEMTNEGRHFAQHWLHNICTTLS
ncbi:uncharacterized protein [Asterias amurensis]|uniref:uncharacterized protein isoform X2 n=1 Tax=Asterias amurensis TaxID=7602 RepID=UPI003AB22D81